jgi:hypothetical protein
VVAADVGVRWLPVPDRGDRRRGALVGAQPTTRADAAFTELPQAI